MNILEISALPVWSMEGKGGMPSLRETLSGHLRAGHHIELILPRYDLFSDELSPLTIRQDQGYKVTVAPCGWLPIIKRLRKFARSFTGGKSIPYPARWILNVGLFFCLTVSLYRESRRLFRKGFSPDLVYAHNQYASLAGFLLGVSLGIPNVTRLYGTFLADLMQKPFVSLRYPTASAGYLVPSSLLICGNDGTRGDEVARKFRVSNRRFRFWQNGVDPPSGETTLTRHDFAQKFGSDLKSNSKWIVSCSRLSYWKRIDRMIRAMQVCKAQGVYCQLLIAGEGPELTNLKRLADEMEVSEYVVWLGALAHDEIWALMKAADVFIIANDVTNRCNPLYEAAWAGLPVVSVFDPSTKDLLKNRENALLVDKEDTVSLGERLVELCNDSALADQLKAEQKKLSESFWTWEERMRVEVTELEKLVSKHNDESVKYNTGHEPLH